MKKTLNYKNNKISKSFLSMLIVSENNWTHEVMPFSPPVFLNHPTNLIYFGVRYESNTKKFSIWACGLIIC